MPRRVGRRRSTTRPTAGSGLRSGRARSSTPARRRQRRDPRSSRPSRCAPSRTHRVPSLRYPPSAARRGDGDTSRDRRRYSRWASPRGGHCASWPARSRGRDRNAAAWLQACRPYGRSHRQRRSPRPRTSPTRNACRGRGRVRRQSASRTCRGWRSRYRRHYSAASAPDFQRHS